jgi:hypothetical protein
VKKIHVENESLAGMFSAKRRIARRYSRFQIVKRSILQVRFSEAQKSKRLAPVLEYIHLYRPGQEQMAQVGTLEGQRIFGIDGPFPMDPGLLQALEKS